MLENIYNQRVTILNKLKRTDSKTGVDVWRKSIVDDVVWYTKSSRSAGSSSVFIGTYITVLFPFNSRYLPYMEWKKPENQEEHFTMSSGDYIILDEYPILKNMLIRKTSLEFRAANFFVKKNMIKRFKEEFEKLFKNDFILMSKKEVIKSKLFGNGKASDKFESCLGDYLALAISDKGIIDEYDSNPLKGLHAGVTEDEVLVPLIVIDKHKKSKKTL